MSESCVPAGAVAAITPSTANPCGENSEGIVGLLDSPLGQHSGNDT